MKRISFALLCLCLPLLLAACRNSEQAPIHSAAESNAVSSAVVDEMASVQENLKPESGKSIIQQETDNIQTAAGSDDTGENDEMTHITITIANTTFAATLTNTEAARRFAERFPLTLRMSDLHGNEKYNYLQESLPTNSKNPDKICAGDLMLFGSDCLVLFYESFSSGFSYTPLGSLDDAAGLADAVGDGSVTVKFDVAE